MHAFIFKHRFYKYQIYSKLFKQTFSIYCLIIKRKQFAKFFVRDSTYNLMHSK